MMMMKLFPFALVLQVLSSLGTGGSSVLASSGPDINPDDVGIQVIDPTKSFVEWSRHHQKVYESLEERTVAEQIWKDNYNHVQAHNDAYYRGYTLYAKTMAGPFSDMTDAMFTADYLMESQNCSATHVSSGRLRPTTTTTATTAAANTHLAVDWRTKGILTPVKQQGKCGSCWTFSTSGCLESHVCLQANIDCTSWAGLSEEQLVECAGNYNNHGCSGGLPSHAYQYLKENGGMAREADYPYVAPTNGGKNQCSLADKHGWRARVAEVYNITTLDEDDLVHAIATIGPVSIAYQVSPDFRFYSHGIYDSYNHTTDSIVCKSGPMDVNHAVVAVGLGTSVTNATTGATTDYYIVRNSWSADWGMEGHFWIKRGENLCGISDCASFPIVPVNQDDDDTGLLAPPFLNNNKNNNNLPPRSTTEKQSLLRKSQS